MHIVLTVTPHAEEEHVFANMLAQFLARAGTARRDLKHRALEVRHVCIHLACCFTCGCTFLADTLAMAAYRCMSSSQG